jgi:hypothetical protein
MSGRVDPGWTGIVEVLVSGLDGAVRWEPDSVVLQLPDHTETVRRGDLDGLRLCLGRIGAPVVYESSGLALHDASLIDFLSKLTDSGLLADARQSAA